MKVEATRIIISRNRNIDHFGLNLCIFEFLINPDPLCSFTRGILYSSRDCIKNSIYKLWGPNQFLRILNNIQLIANTWYNIAYDIKDSDIVLQKSIIPLESFYISRELISEICKCSVNSKEIQETLDKYVRG